jgi:hypothetical protein
VTVDAEVVLLQVGARDAFGLLRRHAASSLQT